MPKIHKPRAGSLQFWPRKRADKVLPSANFRAISERISEGGHLLGFIGYKAGMQSILVEDSTEHSMTKGKKIVLPVTIIECPPMKILSVRLYKNGKVLTEAIKDNLDKELKGKIKISKKQNFKNNFEEIEKKLGEADDIRVIVYSVVKKTGIKKTPDIIELGLSGSLQEKFETVKKLLNKEITIADVFKQGQLIDIHGVTKGHGFTGPVKRYGIGLRSHKAEKGVRRPGSLGPWHPARVTYLAPLAGQHGYFTRVQYNNKIIEFGDIGQKNINPPSGFTNFGLIKTNYLLLKGSVQGPVKRPLLLTYPLRETKKTKKQNFRYLKTI